MGESYGIPIFLHPSWFLIFALIAFSFVSEFDALHLNIPTSRLWGLGLMTSVLFFGSLVFHEMSHSVIAKHYKIPVVSITLFVFGGVARISRDPSRAIEEFNIAVAGPISSFLLAGGFWLVHHGAGSNAVLKTLAGSLAWINFSLAIFNLVPGFPARRRAHFPGHRLGHHEGLFALDANRRARRPGRGLRHDRAGRWDGRDQLCAARRHDQRNVARVHRLVPADGGAPEPGAGRCARGARRVARGRHHDPGIAHDRPRDFTGRLRAGNDAHRTPRASGGRARTTGRTDDRRGAALGPASRIGTSPRCRP